MLKILKLFGKKGIRKPGKAKQILNLQKDKVDERDYTVSMAVSTNVAMPTRMTLKQFAPDIKQQGSIGSCGAHAYANAIELLYNKERNDKVATSELYFYYKVRELMGTVGKDSGIFLRDGAKCLNENGICLEQYWPYITSKYNEEPSWVADFCAKFIRTKGYYRCNNVNDIKVALADGNPVVFGVWVDQAFCQDRTGTPQVPIDQQHCIGGHAMLIVGYDDTKNAFEVLNSWGHGWGNAGYCWMPYTWINQLLIDAWVVKLR